MALNKLLLLCTLLVSVNSYGGIYKCADGRGGVVYSDTECATRADRKLVKTVQGPMPAPPQTDSPSGSPVSALLEKLQAKLRGLGNSPALTSALPSTLPSGLSTNGLDIPNGLDISQLTQVLQALQALQCGGDADCLQTASCNEVGQLMGLCSNTEWMASNAQHALCANQGCR